MWWRFGIANVARYPVNSAMQLSNFGLSFMVLLLLTFVQHDLLKTWRTQLPEKISNYFIANIQPTDVENVKKIFEEKDLKVPFYSMLPAHLTKINGKTAFPDDFSSSQAKRLVGRAFNLSWTEKLPIGNEILQGEWWSNQVPELYIENGIANLLSIKLGNTLYFTSGGQEISLKVKNL